jgi:hypothetical protein
MAPTGQSCKVGVVHPDEVPKLWKKVLPQIERCVPHSEGEMEAPDFYVALIDGEMQLWIAVEDEEVIASMVTQIIPYPAKKVLRVIAIAGEDMDKWFHFQPDLEEFAILMGCSSLEAWGRKGWKKILKDWKDSYVVYTKELDRRLH